jgi:hypothetical protein
MKSKQYVFFSLIFLTIIISMSFPSSFADTGSVTMESYDVTYNIENGNIESIFMDPDFLELLITMSTTDDGTIEITIPRAILDAKFDTTDDVFFTLVDGFETDYVEIPSTSDSRTLVIPFFGGDSIIEIIGTNALNPFVAENPTQIPDWVKSNAGWWSDGMINDSDFVSGIQYLINEGIMTIPPTQSGQSTNNEIPTWVKSNAGWWSDGSIDDNTFIQGIQYLISNGIMPI